MMVEFKQRHVDNHVGRFALRKLTRPGGGADLFDRAVEISPINCGGRGAQHALDGGAYGPVARKRRGARNLRAIGSAGYSRPSTDRSNAENPSGLFGRCSTSG